MLSNKLVEKLGIVGETLSLADMNSKALFSIVYDEFLITNKENLSKVKKEINKRVEELFPSTNIQSAIKRIVSVAHKYSELQVLSHIDRLNYDNVKSVVSFLTFMSKHYPDEVKKVRNKLGRVKGDTDVEYNNKYHTKIHELRELYKVVETTEGDTIKAYNGGQLISVVKKNLNALTDEEKLELIALLQVEEEVKNAA